TQRADLKRELYMVKEEQSRAATPGLSASTLDRILDGDPVHVMDSDNITLKLRLTVDDTVKRHCSQSCCCSSRFLFFSSLLFSFLFRLLFSLSFLRSFSFFSSFLLSNFFLLFSFFFC